jgi:2-polyprenyl-3-methyl-5-hydroxy-6-metoxy-1,4-benzoquinol methylase
MTPVVAMPDLTRRVLQEEIMDDPALEASEHRRALKALAMVNRLSLTAGRIWREVRRLATARPNPGELGGKETPAAPEPGGTEKHHSPPLRLLDIACGGGDTVRSLARKARRAGVPLEVHGCDVSPEAVDHARRAARKEGLEATFFRLNVLRSPIPGGFDLVTSTLFLHHLAEEDAVRVLARMSAAGSAVLLQDLIRTHRGYWLAHGTLRVLSRSRVAQVDGPRSVRASFRIPEVRFLADRAGLEGARIQPCWPQRFALYWSRP